MYAGKRGQHDGERFLSAQYRDTGQFLPVLAGLVEPLYAVECAETGYLVPLFLAEQKQHERIHAVVIASRQITRPLQRSLREPRLMPVLTDTLDFLDHHLGEKVQRLILAVRPFRLLFPVSSHDRY